MENASKALIIAGAILLAILLISLGIMIFNQARDTVSGSGMSKAEISAFNAEITKYEGNKKGSLIKSMISDINTSNAADVKENNGRQVTIEGAGSATKTYNPSTGTPNQYSTSSISSTATYKVTIEDYDNSGYISKVKIEKVS